MKSLFIILLLSISAVSFGQFIKGAHRQNADMESLNRSEKIKVYAKDSVIKVTPNALQLQNLQEIEKQIQSLQAQYEKDLQLILGIRKEEIDKLDFKDGVFIVTKKK